MLGKRKWITAASSMAAAGIVLAACSTPTAAPVENTPTPEAAAAPGPTAVPEVGMPVIESPTAGGPAAVANYNTYIFSGPGKDYVVYGAFLGGQQAKVVGRSDSGAWWAISVPPAPGATGWVDGAWVTVTGADSVPTLPTPPVPATTDLVPPAAGDPQATALVNTYVRAGPAEAFPAYGIAPEGVTARVIGKSTDGTYWVVRLNPATVGAGYGWVGASAVQASNADAVPAIESPAAPPPVPPSTPAAGAATATAADYVYVRSGAGTCFSSYGVAAPGATGEIAGKSSDGLWWQVKIPTAFAADGLGWVSAGYVSTANADAVPAVAADPCPAAPVPPPATYACFLQAQAPADYTALAPGTAFDMNWTVVNTGNDTWNKNVAVFVQAGQTGTLHTGDESVGPLADDITNGESVEVSVPAQAPSSAGTYGELWEINANGTVVCQFWMIINVAP